MNLAKYALPLTRGSMFFAFFGLLTALPTSTLADIMISPIRAVLDDSNRQTTITLRNPGQIERAYRIRWSERRLDAQDGMVQLKEGEENPQAASKTVRFSPRRVVVGPGQLQTIRLDYRPSPNLGTGEYRSHLVIGLEPQQSGTKVMEDKKEGMSVQLNALISFSLPVIVRHGPGKAIINIVSVAPEKATTITDFPSALRVGMTRAGEFGSYGRLVVYHQSDANAPVKEIGKAGAVAIYAESDQISRVVELDKNVNLNPGSWLRVVYEGEGAEMGKIFAEKSFQIGK